MIFKKRNSYVLPGMRAGLILTAVLILSSCSSQPGEGYSLVSPNQAGTDSTVNLANPASLNCEEQGGRLEIRTGPQGGQFGVCIFPDGSECEEWAFFRDECKPSDHQVAPTPIPDPIYTNPEYGFSIDSTGRWSIEGYPDHVIFRDGNYFLFVGFVREGDPSPAFRSGLPAGELFEEGTFTLLGESRPKYMLEDGDKIKMVRYGEDLPAGHLRLFIWLDIDPPEGVDYAEIEIPDETIAEANQILESFSLTGGE